MVEELGIASLESYRYECESASAARNLINLTNAAARVIFISNFN